MSSSNPSETRSTCCYCGTGCGVVIRTQGDRIVGIAGDPDHPSSRGKLCSKGSTLHLTMTPGAMAGRARHPEMRTSRAATRERVSWDAALDHVAQRFAEIIATHGRDAVAFYVSGQLLTEDYYAFNKLAKGLIGTANIDTNSRLCMSSAVSGYARTLGVDAPPNCYDDIEHADCLFIAGSNTAYAHPVLFRRIEAAKQARPELRIVVVDPRRTDTARFADLHLAILPGTDVALFHAMLHLMLWEKLVDERYIAAHTEGFEELREVVREMSPQAAASICGVKAADIVTAARWFATSPATLSLYCQGLNQSASGTAKNATLIDLHLATGQIGRAGAGPFSLTGQPNAMGGREVGGLATSLAAHRDLASAADRAEVARLWGVDSLPERRGLTAVEMFEALRVGKVKAVWIACTNPAQSLPDLPKVRAALEAAELVVLQEAYGDTETAAFADVLLPASSWGEKDGTVTNSERRISRVRAAVPKPWEARHDWEIACDFAGRLAPRLRGLPGAGRDPIFPTSPEALWNEHRELTRGRDLDITGLSYELLERDGPQQWPFPEGATQGLERLYAGGQFPTPSGRARFFTQRFQPVAERVDASYPLRLTTGRLRDQWHGMSRTGTVASLYGHAPEPRLAMNAQDMARRALAEGELVRVDSRRGAIHVIAHSDESIRSGQAYLPMHWGKRFLGGRDSAGVNTITSPAIDPISFQPELKHAAVKVTASALAWHVLAFAELAPEAIAPTLAALQELQGEVRFASAVLIGRERPGLLWRAAHDTPASSAWLERLDSLFGLVAENTLRYEDPRRHQSRRILIADDRLRAVRLGGTSEAVARGEWLRDWLIGGESVALIRRILLSPENQGRTLLSGVEKVGSVPGFRVTCQCFGVSESAIRSMLAECTGSERERMAALQSRLQCGTNCGSCLPELRALTSQVEPAAVPRRVASQ
jgi:assimilatory nitrate reductase catalytic subunit